MSVRQSQLFHVYIYGDGESLRWTFVLEQRIIHINAHAASYSISINALSPWHSFVVRCTSLSEKKNLQMLCPTLPTSATHIDSLASLSSNMSPHPPSPVLLHAGWQSRCHAYAGLRQCGHPTPALSCFLKLNGGKRRKRVGTSVGGDEFEVCRPVLKCALPQKGSPPSFHGKENKTKRWQPSQEQLCARCCLSSYE